MRIQNPESRIQLSAVSCQLSAVSLSMVCCLLFIVCFQFSGLTAKAAQHPRATEVVAAAVEAMGGRNYLEVKNYHKVGRYFIFDQRGRSSFTSFSDWTVFEPIKWRFQLGEDKRQQVQIYNLEIGKGWILEGKNSVEEIPEEEVREFEVEVQRDIDILLRKGVDEEGMNLFYYGPEEIAGSGEYEAVEFLDATNYSVVIFFDLQSHLPSKMETYVTNKAGVRQKHETEFANWHTIQGVHTPLRSDHYIDGEMSKQIFIAEVSYNDAIPLAYFLEPRPQK
ncbi:MAG: hypothetical protein O7G29_04135 [Acidobacteria bacterium]|nr:hypothetical protein [Acidobacteriota bacterium]